jgi:hypothetical protein
MWYEILETHAGQGQIYPELWVYNPSSGGCVRFDFV